MKQTEEITLPERMAMHLLHYQGAWDYIAPVEVTALGISKVLNRRRSQVSSIVGERSSYKAWFSASRHRIQGNKQNFVCFELTDLGVNQGRQAMKRYGLTTPEEVGRFLAGLVAKETDAKAEDSNMLDVLRLQIFNLREQVEQCERRLALLEQAAAGTVPAAEEAVA